jgi:hypothetical protein
VVAVGLLCNACGVCPVGNARLAQWLKDKDMNMCDNGYRPCACRDCMEIAIGPPGAYCHDCATAGCEADSECCAETDEALEEGEEHE